jgi:hypothetical protein
MEAIGAFPIQTMLNNIQNNQMTSNAAARHVDQL